MSQTNVALTQIIKAMQADAAEIMNLTDLAASDIGENRRNSAIGALCPLDHHVERLSSLLTAVRALHRMQPL